MNRRDLLRAIAVTALGTSSCTARFGTFIPNAQVGGPRRGEYPNESVSVAGTTRVYRLVVPRSLVLDTPAPLVVAFHGLGIDSKDLMPIYTGLNATAERHGFIIVYPEALGGSWGLSVQKIAADITFFDALLKQLSATYRIDPTRIYLTGMSNGGYFSHLLAKERSTTIAAAMSHSGPLGLQTLVGINAQRKFPVMIVHGTEDQLFPVTIAQENVDKYRREGHEVNYVEVSGLGHAWASSININEQMWAFFAKQVKLP